MLICYTVSYVLFPVGMVAPSVLTPNTSDPTLESDIIWLSVILRTKHPLHTQNL